MGLIRILAIVFLIILVFRLLARFVFPWLLRSFISKTQRDFEQKRQDLHDQQHPQRPEGEVTIKTTSKKKQNKGNDDDSEYVDFEEVD